MDGIRLAIAKICCFILSHKWKFATYKGTKKICLLCVRCEQER